MKTAVVINEQHNLLPGQIELLSAMNHERYEVPATGWTVAEQISHAETIGKNYDAVVFVSPVPVMIAKISLLMGMQEGEKDAGIRIVPQGIHVPRKLFIFAKEKRASKEYAIEGDNIQISSKLSDEFVLVEIKN